MIDAGALMELTLKIDDLRLLELRTPSLRVLCLDELDGLAVSAPRLHNLTSRVRHPLRIDKDDGLLSVIRLTIELKSHGYQYDGTNDGAIRLLQCCRLTTHLEVHLQVPQV